jgi:hypothetical protein
MSAKTKKPKRIREVWFCAVNSEGVPLWPSLMLSRSQAVLWMDERCRGWREDGWRIATLKVTEQ